MTASVAELPVQQRAQDPAAQANPDPSVAKDIHSYFYGGGLTQSGGGVGAQPWDQAVVATAPPDCTDFAVGAGDPSVVLAYAYVAEDEAAHVTLTSPPEMHVAVGPSQLEAAV